LGIILAIKGVSIQEGEHGAVVNGLEGLNFLWRPHYESLWDPKVWFAAAGQMFFTLSVGMGCIQCYASYIRQNQDIALQLFSYRFYE
jgi:SNF family Na+-dependent transporter